MVTTPAPTQASLNAARTAAFDRAKAEGFKSGYAEGMILGRKNERGRLAAILKSAQATTHRNAVHAIAFTSDMTPEQVEKFVADLPDERASSSTKSIFAPQANRDHGKLPEAPRHERALSLAGKTADNSSLGGDRS